MDDETKRILAQNGIATQRLSTRERAAIQLRHLLIGCERWPSYEMDRRARRPVLVGLACPVCKRRFPLPPSPR